MTLKISDIFPDVNSISIKVVDTNAWHWNRLKEWGFSPLSEATFHIDCPMSKCLGQSKGITYKQVLTEMIAQRECNRQQRFTCTGYGGYNLTFHCDWFAVLDISITYRN